MLNRYSMCAAVMLIVTNHAVADPRQDKLSELVACLGKAQHEEPSRSNPAPNGALDEAVRACLTASSRAPDPEAADLQGNSLTARFVHQLNEELPRHAWRSAMDLLKELWDRARHDKPLTESELRPVVSAIEHVR